MAPKPRYQELIEKVRKLEKQTEELRRTEAALREGTRRFGPPFLSMTSAPHPLESRRSLILSPRPAKKPSIS